VGLLGLAVVAAGYLGYLAMLFVLRRFTYRTWLFDAVILAGVAIALLGIVGGGAGPATWIAVALGVAWYPVTRRELTLVGSDHLAIRPGDRLPAFTAARTDGSTITDADVIAQAPALLVLYRGWWCPSTRALHDDLLRDHEDLVSAGLTTFAASVDPPARAAGMQAYDGDGITIVCSFPVEVLDRIGARDRRGAPWYDRLIFRAPPGDIAMPTSLVVDASGRIVYAARAQRVDDRVRCREILASVSR
jgi:peroxiredoxin